MFCLVSYRVFINVQNKQMQQILNFSVQSKFSSSTKSIPILKNTFIMSKKSHILNTVLQNIRIVWHFDATKIDFRMSFICVSSFFAIWLAFHLLLLYYVIFCSTLCVFMFYFHNSFSSVSVCSRIKDKMIASIRLQLHCMARKFVISLYNQIKKNDYCICVISNLLYRNKQSVI